MTPNERRMDILHTLIKRKEATLGNLAFEFGVSKRTIQYDMEILSLSYPIYSKAGNGGGIRIDTAYKLGDRKFKQAQESFLRSLFPRLSVGEQAQMENILEDFTYPPK